MEGPNRSQYIAKFLVGLLLPINIGLLVAIVANAGTLKYAPAEQDPRLLAIAKPIYNKLKALGAKNMVPLNKITLRVHHFDNAPFAPEVAIAECAVSLGGARVIEIQPRFFKRMSDIGLEQVLLHELGHCALGMDHRAGKPFEDGSPSSVMSPYHFSDDQFMKHREYYYNEVLK